MTVRHVSLLRGINVGGNNVISMAALRAIYERLGGEDVTTHLQSGNVLFRCAGDPASAAAGVEAAIREEHGLEVRVLGRSHAQLGRIVAVDPFPDADPSRRLVLFLAAKPSAARKWRTVTRLLELSSAQS